MHSPQANLGRMGCQASCKCYYWEMQGSRSLNTNSIWEAQANSKNSVACSTESCPLLYHLVPSCFWNQHPCCSVHEICFHGQEHAHMPKNHKHQIELCWCMLPLDCGAVEMCSLEWWVTLHWQSHWWIWIRCTPGKHYLSECTLQRGKFSGREIIGWFSGEN